MQNRLIFGPARSYTTSIWKLAIKENLYFHTHNQKEIFDEGPINRIVSDYTLEDYMAGNDESKIFIDCSLILFNFNKTKIYHNPKKIFNDYCIYNVRNFKKVIRSFLFLIES